VKIEQSPAKNQEGRASFWKGVCSSGGIGFDVVFNCTHSTADMNGMYSLLRPRGTVCHVGGSQESFEVKAQELRRGEFTIVSSRRYQDTFKEAVRVLQQYESVVKPLVTHEFKGSEMISALEMSADSREPRVGKIQIDLSDLS
jgi:threonine dehydrogenase-like Zn-dependent dehydrogenase